MRKTILCPTDFSEHSEKVIKFAQQIALVLHADILLFHTVNVPVTVGGKEMTEPEKRYLVEDHSVRNKLIHACNELKHSIINKGKDIRYDFLWEDGLPVDAVKRTVEERKISMIIMGTSGSDRDNYQGIYMESNAAAIMEEVNCPLLVVPVDMELGGIERIAYGMDTMHYNCDLINQALDILLPFQSDVTFVNITEEADSKVIERFRNAKSNILENIFYENTDFAIHTASGIVTGLTEYALQNNIDLLVMNTFKRNFIAKIFDPSQTKKMLYRLKLPLLIMKVS